MTARNDPKNDSADFWNNWVYPEGATPEQIQAELQDYHDLMERARQVYEYVTGGRISKLTTTAEAIIAVAEEVTQEAINAALDEQMLENLDRDDMRNILSQEIEWCEANRDQAGKTDADSFIAGLKQAMLVLDRAFMYLER